MHRIIQSVWESGQIPSDWKKGIIIPFYKKRGKTQRPNYRGITLLSVTGKLFMRILIRRVQRVIKQHYWPNQAGCRPGLSTTDNIFILHKLLEKCPERNKNVWCLFIDFKQPFDSVFRKGLLNILRRWGSYKTIDLLEKIYDLFECSVRIRKVLSD